MSADRETVLRHLGQGIRDARSALGHSQRQFGLRIGLSTVAVSKLEQGERWVSPASAMALRRAGVSLDQALAAAAVELATGAKRVRPMEGE